MSPSESCLYDMLPPSVRLILRRARERLLGVFPSTDTWKECTVCEGDFIEPQKLYRAKVSRLPL